MKGKILILILSFTISIAFSQQDLEYFQVSISLENKTIEQLAEVGIALDHSHISKNNIEVVINQNELDLLLSLGFNVDIQHSDLENYYVERNLTTSFQESFLFCDNFPFDTFSIPQAFNYGSMSGYLTYDEMLLEIDSMVTKYPDLISIKTPVDTFLTQEGRPIYVVKISDNPNIDESSTENKVLYTALHHAREPISMMQMIFYMQYLLENYDNGKVKYIVDNMELYFVPCVNPDGYVYNEVLNPSGGGLWRKNRRNNGDGTYGVDLNRNYGHNWGIDNIGSSPNTNSDTYRGRMEFSEPETKAIKYLCDNNEFKSVLNYHAYGNVLIYPTGYKADSLRYKKFSQILTEHNHYTYGNAKEAIGYEANGDSDAWMYEGAINKAYAFTPEIGSYDFGFWPEQSRIIDLCKKNIHANMEIALLASSYVSLNNTSTYVTEQNDSITIVLNRLGLESYENVEIKLLDNDYYTSSNSVKNLSILNDLEFQEMVFHYSVSSNKIEGDVIPIKFEITVDQRKYHKTFYRVLSTQQSIYSEKFDFQTNDWDKDLWGITQEKFYSSPNSITDSPNKNYSPNIVNELVLSKNINLTDIDYVNAFVKFKAKWETEDGFDYVQFIVDDGLEETPMCGKYTNLGVGITGQPNGEPLYDGVQNEWIDEYIDITDYLGSQVNFKFVLTTDGANQMDGFYIDDFQIFALKNKGLNVEEIALHDEVVITPNPANDVIYLPINENEADIQIYNSIGVKMNVNRDENKINVSNFPVGVYKIVLSNNKLKYIKTSTFIKQ